MLVQPIVNFSTITLCWAKLGPAQANFYCHSLSQILLWANC